VGQVADVANYNAIERNKQNKNRVEETST